MNFTDKNKPGNLSFLPLCTQEFRGALSVYVGGTTSRVRSVRSGSVPASQLSGSVMETTTAGTTVMRTDAVSPLLFFCCPLFSLYYLY